MAACNPFTTRPAYGPLPFTPKLELELTVPQATQTAADALKADSIPVSRVEERDGWFETPWFNATTGQPTTARPLGPDIVRVNGWITPTREYHSSLVVEVVYRPLADPSIPSRQLDQAVPADNAAAVRLRRTLRSLGLRYGDSTTVQALSDSTGKAADSTRAVTDSTRKAVDSSRTPADTTRKKP